MRYSKRQVYLADPSAPDAEVLYKPPKPSIAVPKWLAA